MRTIKFRGRCAFSGTWRYGFYYVSKENHIIRDENDRESIVLEKTVCELSPFKDKNEQEIFEGDIIGDWNEIDGKMEQSRLTVYFDEMLGQWMLDNSFNQDRTFSCSLFSELKDFEYEVLGNIYENSELLTD